MRARLRSGDGRQVEAMAFRAAGQPLGAMLTAHRGKPLHLAGTASINRWQGQERVQFRILDAAVPPNV
jgi:single-stranded-DNA-specific exonuclease